MIYSNDESDKSLRFKNHFLTVYLIPTLVVIGISFIVYLCVKLKLIIERELYYGILLSMTLGLYLYTFNKKSWLKMPDGTFHYIKNITTPGNINSIEPPFYEDEFYYSKKEKINSIFTGILSIGLSVWLLIKSPDLKLMPFGTTVFGLFISWLGLKGLLDKTAKLKIAKSGLWTRKLGFVNWDDINYAEVIEDKRGKNPELYLEVRLKGTKFEEVNQPDERLILSDIKNKEDIEMKINNSIIRYNELKNSNGS